MPTFLLTGRFALACPGVDEQVWTRDKAYSYSRFNVIPGTGEEAWEMRSHPGIPEIHVRPWGGEFRIS